MKRLNLTLLLVIDTVYVSDNATWPSGDQENENRPTYYGSEWHDSGTSNITLSHDEFQTV